MLVVDFPTATKENVLNIENYIEVNHILERVRLKTSLYCLLKKKGRITKILNSEENSNLKVPNQMAKSKAQTH